MAANWHRLETKVRSSTNIPWLKDRLRHWRRDLVMSRDALKKIERQIVKLDNRAITQSTTREELRRKQRQLEKHVRHLLVLISAATARWNTM